MLLQFSTATELCHYGNQSVLVVSVVSEEVFTAGLTLQTNPGSINTWTHAAPCVHAIDRYFTLIIALFIPSAANVPSYNTKLANPILDCLYVRLQ